MTETAVPGPEDPLHIGGLSNNFERFFPGRKVTLFVVRFYAQADTWLLTFKGRGTGLTLPFWYDEGMGDSLTLEVSLKELSGTSAGWVHALETQNVIDDKTIRVVDMMGLGNQLPNVSGEYYFIPQWAPAHLHQEQINHLFYGERP